MSDLEELRARNRRLRTWAVVWIIASCILALGFVAVLYIARGDEETAEVVQPAGTPADEASVAEATKIAAPTSSGGAPDQQPQATPEQQPPPASVSVSAKEPVPIDAYGYGVQVHGSVGEPEVALEQVDRLGLGWIKQQVRWGDLELSPGDLNWGMLDGIMAAAQKHGVRVMLSVVTAPVWTRPATGNIHGPPDDINQFSAFLGKLIDQYPGQISAIEVWNEQNLEREWQTAEGLNANNYLEMLKMAHDTIKAKAPSIAVISGALSPTGGWTEPDGRVTAIDDFGYFQQLLDGGLLDHADCVGAHHNGYNIGPDVTAEDAPNEPQAATASFRGPFENIHHSWSFKSTLWGYYNMMGGQKKLCVTEFGWASSEGTGGTPIGFGFSDDNSLQDQAEWIVQAFELQREWGTTWLAFLWNLDYGPKGLGPEDNNVPYSILNLDGSPRPAFETLEAMSKP